MEQWYYRTNEGEFGPITREELVRLAHCGTIRPVDDVRRGASGLWMKPSQSLFDVQRIIEFGLEPYPEPLGMDETDLFVQTGGSIRGPYSQEELRQRVVDGEISADCFVKRGQSGVWFVPNTKWFDVQERNKLHPFVGIIWWFTRSKDAAR